MTKQAIRAEARQLILEQIAAVCYGNDYEKYIENAGDEKIAWEILKEQCDRVAHMFGEKEAWFY